VELLAADLSLPPLRIVLTARRIDRVRAIASYSAARLRRARPDWAIFAEASLAQAVTGADIVILLVRVGGLAARAHDETFPLRFNLPGDEGLGAGGMANAWRTFPVLAEIASVLCDKAISAKVLNLIAPLGLTTRRLLHAGLDAIGVCELPTLTRQALLERCPELAIAGLRYAGLNHLGWFWPTVDLGLESWQPAIEQKIVDACTLETMRAAPLHYYYRIFDQAAAHRLGFTAHPDRALALMDIGDNLFRQLSLHSDLEVDFSQRPTPWFDYAVVPMVRALLGGRVYHGFANVRNLSKVPELPQDCVVEVEVSVGEAGLSHQVPGTVPSGVLKFLRAVSASEAVTYEAAFRRDETLLEHALELLPLPITRQNRFAMIREITRPTSSVCERNTTC
jgi:6-phospho-beta-glucosidase